MTLDPGGTDVDGNAIAAVPLVVTGNVENLTVEGSILASIGISGSGVIDSLFVSDSILQAAAGQPAIAFVPGTATLARVTVLGDLAARRALRDRDAGHRRGHRRRHPMGLLPLQRRAGRQPPAASLRSTELAVGAHVLASTRFGDPDYASSATLRPRASGAARRTAPRSARSARSIHPSCSTASRKVDEYMPFGLIPAFMFET